MQVRVRLFGSIREKAGAKELLVDIPACSSVLELRTLLGRDEPAFLDHSERLRISVNYELAAEHLILSEGDEVAFLPPVSGGSGNGRCTLSDSSLDVGEVVRRVSDSAVGGIVTFVGAVRNESKGHSIRHLEYEAYAPMAIAEMEKIVREAEDRWSDVRVAIAHRTGHLEVGEVAVVVVAAAAHRGEAFDAARYSIDTLKERVPIWKKEVTRDGEYWVEDHA